MSNIELDAIIIDGVIRLHDNSNWHIEQEEMRKSWALYNVPVMGPRANRNLVNRFYNIEEAYEASKEL